MIRLTKAQAARHGIGPKKRSARIDREARVFDIEGCGWESSSSGVRGSYQLLQIRASLTLPFPNSANTHWRHARGCTYLSADGKAFRAAVAQVMRGCPSFGDARLRAVVTLHPPTRRACDLGNFDKALWDALMHAGLFADDGQIDDQRFVRGRVKKPGRAIVVVEILEAAQ